MAADFVRYYTITPASKYFKVEDFVIYYNNKKTFHCHKFCEVDSRGLRDASAPKK